MGNMLYKLHFELDAMLVVLFIMPPVALFILWRSFRKLNDQQTDNGKARPRLWPICAILICAAVIFEACAITSLISQYRQYDRVERAWRSGQYETVEGYVEFFSPMPYAGHAYESFVIDGVAFYYSDFSSTVGYHNARSHGGVITGNGQYLRIGYIPGDDAKDNIIVSIEAPPAPEGEAAKSGGPAFGAAAFHSAQAQTVLRECPQTQTAAFAPSISRMTSPTAGAQMLPRSGFLMLTTGVVIVASTSERSKARSVSIIRQPISFRPLQ